MGTSNGLLYWSVRIVQYFAFAAAVIVLLAPSIPDWKWEWLVSTKSWLTTNGKTLGVVIVPLAGVCTTLRKFIGEPWIWKCIKDILDSFQRDAFDDIGDGQPSDHHRVTLYRYYCLCIWPGWRSTWWPWGYGNWPHCGWLVPVVRAGSDASAKTVYLAKNATETEGVCGNLYFCQSSVLVKSPPAVPDITEAATDDEIAAYSKETFVTEDSVRRRIKKRRPCARYFFALRVEVNSRKWGVLMIDSRADALPQPTVMQHRFKQINKVLGHLLKRA